MKTRVIHVRDLADHPDGVYIGRAVPRAKLSKSRYANPFIIGIDGDRDDVIRKFGRWLGGDPELVRENGEPPTLADIHRDLRGKALACWCAPQPCHGDVLALLADHVLPEDLSNREVLR